MFAPTQPEQTTKTSALPQVENVCVECTNKDESSAAPTPTSGGKVHMAATTPNENTLTVYTPLYHGVMEVPKSKVTHLPSGIRRFVLCDHGDGSGGCKRGKKCRFVHADVKGIPVRLVHVHYAWRSLEECIYERAPPGMRFKVSGPNSTKVTEIPSESLLQTRVFDSPAGKATQGRADDNKRILKRCAHFHLNRTCNMGSECLFAHVAYVDPKAKLHQRAPPLSVVEAQETSVQEGTGTFSTAAVMPPPSASDNDTASSQHYSSMRATPMSPGTFGSVGIPSAATTPAFTLTAAPFGGAGSPLVLSPLPTQTQTGRESATGTPSLYGTGSLTSTPVHFNFTPVNPPPQAIPICHPIPTTVGVGVGAAGAKNTAPVGVPLSLSPSAFSVPNGQGGCLSPGLAQSTTTSVPLSFSGDNLHSGSLSLHNSLQSRSASHSQSSVPVIAPPAAAVETASAAAVPFPVRSGHRMSFTCPTDPVQQQQQQQQSNLPAPPAHRTSFAQIQSFSNLPNQCFNGLPVVSMMPMQ